MKTSWHYILWKNEGLPIVQREKNWEWKLIMWDKPKITCGAAVSTKRMCVGLCYLILNMFWFYSIVLELQVYKGYAKFYVCIDLNNIVIKVA